MTTKEQIPRIETGVRNFDAIFEGGMPKNAVTVVSGAPGSGKTIFCQQICFHAASTQSRVLYCNTLSEPIAKTLRANVNLIYYNEVPELPFKRPSGNTMFAFQAALRGLHVNAHIRKSRGREIAAACGQLARQEKTLVQVRTPGAA